MPIINILSVRVDPFVAKLDEVQRLLGLPCQIPTDLNQLEILRNLHRCGFSAEQIARSLVSGCFGLVQPDG